MFADKDVQRGKKDKKKSAMRVRRALFEGCEDFVCNNNGRRENNNELQMEQLPEQPLVTKFKGDWVIGGRCRQL